MLTKNPKKLLQRNVAALFDAKTSRKLAFSTIFPTWKLIGIWAKTQNLNEIYFPFFRRQRKQIWTKSRGGNKYF